jgi:hypothetical protein
MAGAEVPLSYFCAAGALITSNGWLDVLLWGSTRRSIVFGDVGEEDVGVNTFTFMRTPPNRRFGNMVWVEGGVNNNNNSSSSGSSNRINRSSKAKSSRLSKHNSSRDSSNTSSHMGTSNNSRNSGRDRGREIFVGAAGGIFGRSETVRGVRDRVMRGPRRWRELGSSGLGVAGLWIANGGSSANRSVAASQESLTTGGGLAIQMEMETSVVVEIEGVPQKATRSPAPSASMPAYDEKDMPYLPPIA